MRVFLYEYFVGGGALADGLSDAACRAILPEAAGMWRAVGRDLTKAGVHLSTMADARWSLPEDLRPHCAPVHSAAEERQVFFRLSASAAWTLVIAPETAGALFRRARWALASGGRLASPDPAFVFLAADKTRTCARWRARACPLPCPGPPRGRQAPSDRL